MTSEPPQSEEPDIIPVRLPPLPPPESLPPPSNLPFVVIEKGIGGGTREKYLPMYDNEPKSRWPEWLRRMFS